MGSGFWSEEWPIKPRWWRRLFDERRTRSVAISGTDDGDVCIAYSHLARRNHLTYDPRQYFIRKIRRTKWLLGCTSRTRVSGSAGLIALDEQGNVQSFVISEITLTRPN
jgi:hypothetical protein